MERYFREIGFCSKEHTVVSILLIWTIGTATRDDTIIKRIYKH